MLLGFVATRVDSADKSVGSVDKVQVVQTKSAECRQIAQKVL